MHWENSSPDWPTLPESDVPAELLDGLERLCADGDLLKARLRWRPHQTAATGFLTKDRLLGLQGCALPDVAQALASLASHLYDGGGCESKFEAQVQRELEASTPDGAREREWRSITFYVQQAPEHSFDVGHDDNYESPPYQPPSWEPPGSPEPAVPNYAGYSSFVDLSRSDPNAFAMIVMQQSHDRVVSILERMLFSSVARLDGVLSTQISNSRYLNEALQTLTKGAGDVAGLGVNLFTQGLEGQARVARMEHESELGRERTELMRDAVKQGSLLIQAVLMSNAAKQQQQGQQPRASGDPNYNHNPASAPPPSAAPSSADREIETKARRLLDLATDDVLEGLRDVAPSLAEVFADLKAEPVRADRVRAVIREAQATVNPVELGRASQLFEADIANVFGTLVMRVLSEDP